MNLIFDTLLSYLLLYKYLALFVVVFSSAIILPLPISLLLVAVGAFSFENYFSFPLALTVAVSANVLGDLVDYFFVRLYATNASRDTIARKYSYFSKLEEYVRNHAGLTIFVSRCVGILGPPVNFLAGFMDISFLTFVFFDFLGNLFELGLFLSLGYLLGNEWSSVSGIINTVEGMLLIVFLMYIFLIIRRKK